RMPEAVAEIDPTGEPLDTEIVFDLLERALVRVVAWRLVERTAAVLRYHVPISWATWGDEVDVSLDGSTVVVRSRSRAPFQLVDWGKNRRNVETVRAAIARLAPELRRAEPAPRAFDR
ncbi:MAG: hypothetical protein R3F34_09625, partial [Planctomycetota bacterium]